MRASKLSKLYVNLSHAWFLQVRQQKLSLLTPGHLKGVPFRMYRGTYGQYTYRGLLIDPVTDSEDRLSRRQKLVVIYQNQRAKVTPGNVPRESDFSAKHLALTDRAEWSLVNGDKSEFNPELIDTNQSPLSKGWHWDGQSFSMRWNWEYGAGWNETWSRRPDEKTRAQLPS